MTPRFARNQAQTLDQRAEPRHHVARAAIIDVLGDHAFTLDAQLVNVSSRGMRLSTAQPILADAALRIRVDADHYLGEVTHCSRDGHLYFVGVVLINVLRNAAEVTERLNRMLLPR